MALMTAACGKPEFVKEKTWDVWVANKSDIGLSALRCNALYDAIDLSMDFLSYSTDAEKKEKAMKGMSLYTAFEYVDPLDSRGNIESFEDSWSKVSFTVYYNSFNENRQKFGLDISSEEFRQFISENVAMLKAEAMEMYEIWTLLYESRLRESVSIYKLEKDKERSGKGVSIYDVIYYVSIDDDSRYVQCEILVNDKTDSEEIQIVNSSEYLLDL